MRRAIPTGFTPARIIAWRRRSVWLGLFFCIAMASPASAYVLQGEHVLELTAGALGSAAPIRVTQTVSEPGAAAAGSAAMVRETVTYGFPDRLRIDSEPPSPEDRRLYLVEGERHALFQGGSMVQAAPFGPYLYAELLLARDRRGLLRRLKAAGVDTAVSSLGLHEGRTCYVLGAIFPDPLRPQLWVDKATFTPYRLLVPAPGGVEPVGMTEFRFLDWSSSGSDAYPRRIDILVEGSAVQEIRVLDVAAAPALGTGFFSIASAMAEAQAFRSAPTPASQAAAPDGGAPETPRGSVQGPQGRPASGGATGAGIAPQTD